MFPTRTMCYLLVMVTVFLVQDTQGCARLQKPARPEVCGLCGNPIQFSLVVRNVLVEPLFEFNVTLTDEPQREMIHLLEKAAKMDKRFEYTASYHSQWGYFLTTLHGQSSSQEDNYYWIMSEFGSGDSLMNGLSSHIPQHQDVVLFNLTSFGH